MQDLSRFDASRETSQFDAAEKKIPPEDAFRIDKWKRASIDISVPTREKKKEGNGLTFSVDGLRYRPILDVVRAVFAEASSKNFHFTPFKRLWKSSLTGHQQCVYDELYASDAWNQAHDDIMKQRRDDGCKLERVIAGLMFWLDSTRLAQFGHASAWPIYLFFGNLSKYARSNPESGCCHPIAFIPSVSRFLSFLLCRSLIQLFSFRSPSKTFYPRYLARNTTATFSLTASENSFTQSGHYYLMMISSRLTRMELS